MFSTSPSLSKTNPQSPEINIGTNITCKQTQFEAKQNDRVGEGGREGEREKDKKTFIIAALRDKILELQIN